MSVQSYKKILVINLGGIGDLLLSTPALRSLKNTFPGASLEMLVAPRVAGLARDFPYISSIHIFSFGWGGFFRNIATVVTLRRRRFDIALNMRTINSAASAWKMKWFIRSIRPKVCAGRDTAGRGCFFDIRIPESALGDKSVMEYDLELAGAVGAHAGDRGIDFAVGAKERARVNALFVERGIRDAGSVVGIHPGGRPSRRWPIENFALLMQRLSQAIPCTFVITGDAGEKPLARTLVQAFPGAVDLTGNLTIQELGACISRYRLFISNDTGPMHIAAILKVPQIALFGPGSLAWYNPSYLSPRAVALHAKIDCLPCEKPHCAQARCMKLISVNEVAQQALNVLKAPPHGA